MNFRPLSVALTGYILFAAITNGEEAGNETGLPIDANIPASETPDKVPARKPAAAPIRTLYPWKTYVPASVFWVGGKPTDRDPAPHSKSSWDPQWSENFGGYDDPEPANRMADQSTGDFRPKGFVPKLNPFYVALPYNDLVSGAFKPDAAKIIPWFARVNPVAGKSVCKGRWVQIYNGSRSCYAQWEDSGPQATDDWEFVFGNKPPKATDGNPAGIAISPSVRDYLEFQSEQKVHWRFVEAGQVPSGPWKKYGPEAVPADKDPDAIARQKYVEYRKKLEDDQAKKRSVGENQQ